MTMLGRRLLTAEIYRNDTASVIRMSKPDDFATGPLRPIGRKSLKTEMVLPYVIDIAHGRTLYVRGVDAQRLREASFANVHARNHATSIVSVPWEAGPINPPVDAEPIYVFSPGRCGSTLLHSILMAAQIPSVSEPDVATALISATYQDRRLMRPLLRWA